MGGVPMQKIRCSYCGNEKRKALVHKCMHCGKMHCITHRLPERHECPSIALTTKRNPIGPATHGKKQPGNAIFSTSETKKYSGRIRQNLKGFF